ncbi:MAG: hypothetical protein RLZZ127_353 [Planctomycetota bacterium]|jgi:hypothetical protein
MRLTRVIPVLLACAAGLPALDTVTIETVTPVIEESAPVAATVARVVRTGSSGNLRVPIIASSTTGFTLVAGATPVTFTGNRAVVTIPDGATSIDLAMQPIDDTVVETSVQVSFTAQISLSTPLAYILGAETSADITVADDDMIVRWDVVRALGEEGVSGDLPPEIVAGIRFRTRSGTSASQYERRTSYQFISSTTALTTKPVAELGTDYRASLFPRQSGQSAGTSGLATEMRSAAFRPTKEGGGWSGIKTLTDDTASKGTGIVRVERTSDSELAGNSLTYGERRVESDGVLRREFKLSIGDLVQFGESNPERKYYTVTSITSGSATGAVWNIGISPDLAEDVDGDTLIRNTRDLDLVGSEPGETLVFGRGITGADIILTPLYDSVFEGSETIPMRLVDNNVSSLDSKQMFTGVIADDDLTVDIRAGQDAGRPGTPGYVIVRLSEPLSQPITVGYDVVDVGSRFATEGVDFRVLPRKVTVPARETEVRIQVEPIGSGAVSESVTIKLNDSYDFKTAGLAGGSADPSATIHIVPLSGTISVRSATAAGAESGTPTDPAFRISVARAAGVTGAIGVEYSMSGTATEGSDYDDLTGTATIPAGQNEVIVPVRVRNDAVSESTETVILTIRPVAGYQIDAAAASATATITDDEPTISVSAVGAVDEDAAPVSFVLTYSGPTLSGSLQVAYSLSGSAAQGVDYTVAGVSGTASFVGLGGGVVAPVLVTIDPVVDGIVEGNETVTLKVISSTAYSAASASGATITIRDIDSPPPAGKPTTDSGSGGSSGCGLGSGLAAILAGLFAALRLGLRRRR